MLHAAYLKRIAADAADFFCVVFAKVRSTMANTGKTERSTH